MLAADTSPRTNLCEGHPVREGARCTSKAPKNSSTGIVDGARAVEKGLCKGGDARWSECASAIEGRVKSSGDKCICGQEEVETTCKANDDYEMSRCDMVLDDGGAGIPGTLGIIEVGWSAGARLNQDFHGARMQQ
uniref:Uncharacterized protein n=1 Tax=Peronospora matthiolae TaxID=2874970 RepID=A0AAV1UTZ3_9STRA